VLRFADGRVAAFEANARRASAAELQW